ncbi:MAG TPA: hypothetical protein VNK49_12070 [Anaerolineales bacterium]|nr:hypothetical protein [Anaerolineales bacterium]
MKNKLFILFAAATLVAVSLACAALSPQPTASNFYMATDESGETRTTVYSSDDDFFIFFDVSGIEPGTQFQARWYVLDLEGEDPNTPFQTTDYFYEEGVSTIYFQLTNDSGWPSATYRVEIYMNGTKVGEQQFSVQ